MNCQHCDGTGWRQVQTATIRGVVRCACRPATGQELKTDGEQRALRFANNDWKQAFEAEILRRGRAGLRFKSEHITQVVGLPHGTSRTNRNNAVGAMMSLLAKRGVIRSVGYEPSGVSRSHGALVAVWEVCDDDSARD